MKPICICGHFGFGHTKLNGQTIKTKITCQGLENVYGAEHIMKVDTAGTRCLLMLIPRMAVAAMRCDHIVILPARKGLQVIIPLLFFLRLFFSFKTHHMLIGGWLAGYLKEKPLLEKLYARVATHIYAETTVSCQALRERGYTQAVVLPNFKKLDIISPADLPAFRSGQTLKLCTFSRVMQKKGIADAVDAVRRANEKLGRDVYTLSIYGQVERGEEEWFERLKQEFPPCVTYGGCIPFAESTVVLRNCFALLFPTLYYTEGVPGTIIDAYASGTPVIAARWESYADVVSEGSTGIGYPMGDTAALVDILVRLAENPQQLHPLRLNCIERAKAFLPESVLPEMLKRFV